MGRNRTDKTGYTELPEPAEAKAVSFRPIASGDSYDTYQAANPSPRDSLACQLRRAVLVAASAFTQVSRQERSCLQSPVPSPVPQ